MEKSTSTQTKAKGPTIPSIPSAERRLFLRHLGLFAASTTSFLMACSKSLDLTPTDGSIVHSGARVNADGSIDLGSGDIGILNYAYALEQLETAFYTLAQEKTAGLTFNELQILQEIREHELVHREFFRAVLGANAIPDLDFDFSMVNFNNRDNVFEIANKLESTGVGAYNGAARYIKNADIIGIAGKIVSVEARHASVTGHMYLPLPGSTYSFGFGTTDSNGLDIVYKPSDVLPIAQGFIKQKLSGANLPTTNA